MKRKNKMPFMKVLSLALLVITSYIGKTNAQMCGYAPGQGCSNTDYNNAFLKSNNNAATIEYDNFVSTFHSTIIRTTSGGFKVWGQNMANNGNSSNFSAVDLNSTNYPALGNAKVYKVTGGSSGDFSAQFIALASDGLYAWGRQNTVIDDELTTSRTFQKISVNGKSDGLPAGVSPENIKMMTASAESLVIVTCEGNVWVLAQNANLRGNGATGSSTVWSKVETGSAGNYLSDIVAARVVGSNAIALKSDGTVWVWGARTYLGDNTAPVARSRATQITIPAGTPKMIGITGFTTYYILMTNGNLWTVGQNFNQQLGDWTTTSRNSWIQPRYTSASGPVMNNITWISPNESDTINGMINVLTNTGRLYAWGRNDGNCLGGGSANEFIDPKIPNNLSSSDKIIAVETGGHTSMIVKECTSNFGYVGHRVSGSMGNGSTTDVIEEQYTFATAPVSICGAEPVTNIDIDNNDSSVTTTSTPACAGSTIKLAGYPAGGTWSVVSGSATVSPSGLATFPTTGSSVIQYTSPTTCNSTTTATITLTTNNVTPGVIGSNQSVPSGGDPAPFTVTTPASGSGTISYQWQSSTNGGTTWSDILGATSATYDPPAGISVTTQYRRADTSTLSGSVCTKYSNIVVVTVCPAGNAAPNLNNTTAYSNSTGFFTIPCGSTTANLSALIASNTPSGSIITWHSASIPTAANRINPATAVAGTNKYYAAFYNSTSNCYSPTKMVTVVAPICSVNDDYTSTPIIAGVGGTLPSIFGNDTYNGTVISTMPANSVDFFYELWTTANATVDGNGNLIIPATTPPGTYTYYYKICDKDSDVATETNCTIAEVKFKVEAVFGCDNKVYLSQNNTLYTINTSSNPFTYPSVGSAAVNHNAMGLNPVDGKIYAMQVLTSNELLQINTDGSSTSLGAVTNLPVATYNAGEIDNAGNYYVKSNAGNNQLYKINLTTKTATLITLSTSVNVSDLSYSIATGLLYGVNSANGQLTTINPSTGTVTGVGVAPGSLQFGAMYTSSTGEVFGVNNAGGFFQFNLTTGARVKISDAPASTSNDGAHCVTMPITFSADLQVSKSDNTTTYIPGAATVYTITVRNNGPFGVLNASVSDPVPAGIPAANVSYTALASTGSTTNVSGTQTGAINDLVGIPMGGTVTYTVTVNVPMSFTGNLVNSVTVTPPANITDSNMANNTATDTDTHGSCFKPGITTGTALDTKHGITALNRAGSDASGNWPMVRKGAWTALEAKTKGFVINRLTTAEIASIPAANLIEGMVVYNKDLNCLQVNTTGTAAGWSCLATPTCPSN